MRTTQQKEVILKFLKEVTSHPTAEEIFLAVRKEMPNISRGTVYRVLKHFKDLGEIKELMAQANHYDGDTSEHSHFICESCHRIYDIFDAPQELKFKKNNSVGQIRSCQVYFYGQCHQCLQRKAAQAKRLA